MIIMIWFLKQKKPEYYILVCWLNLKKIGDDYKLGDFISAVVAQLPMNLVPTEHIIGGTVSCSAVLPNRPSPFDKYDYNEAEKQFIIYPFDYFSLQITTRIITPRLCGTNVVLNPMEC